MNINPIPFLIDRIRTMPALDGVMVSSDLMEHRLGERAVVLALVPGGKRVIRDRMDAFRFILNYYGASKEEASDLAFTVREYLLEDLPDSAHSGVAVNEVEEDDLPWDFDDPESREQRFIHRITIFLYEV